MKCLDLAFLAALLFFAACSKQSPDTETTSAQEDTNTGVESTPYDVDITKSGAILTRYYVIVYFVANSNSVMQIDIPVPEFDTDRTRAPVGAQHKISATLHSGPNIVKYTMPSSGASPAPPADQAPYSHRAATEGFVTYSCTTPKNKRPPQCRITLSLEQMNFGLGTNYSVPKASFDAFSPPP